ncbi:hypothetical protein QAD02_011082 [Eretmocerus hayati]|uniref:Uncharacterized protein n=1 Tax=Eretmocerus hayati TaxID=131215 RepID=A0ACC2NXG5_9HYME|nr:hypothetical protein QAD02_011082 [Eretmocerus hayati]
MSMLLYIYDHKHVHGKVVLPLSIELVTDNKESIRGFTGLSGRVVFHKDLILQLEIYPTLIVITWSEASDYCTEPTPHQIPLNNEQSSASSEVILQEVVQSTVALAQDIGGEGFSDMQNSDLLEIILPERSQLSAADIEEILEDSEQAQAQENSGDITESSFSTRALAEILNAVQNAIDQAFDKDPILTRSLKFKQDCELASLPYRELYRDSIRRSRQTRMTDFLAKT